MLGSRIEAMLEQETANSNNVSMVTDEAKQRQLLTEDEDEDFLDEGTHYVHSLEHKAKESQAQMRLVQTPFSFIFMG